VGLLVVVAMGLSASVPAQTPSDVRDGRVAVIGENPGIRLVAKEGAPPSTSVSFWRVFQSPAGMGHVCFVTSDVAGDGPTPDDIRLAFADNAKLADYVASQLMTAFDKAYGEKPFPVRTARFERSGDTATAWKETIRSDGYTIELVWRDFYEPFAIESRVGVPHNPYTILSTFIPAKTADVLINGKRAAGTVTPRMRGTRQSSSAFLAFAETWLKADPQSLAEFAKHLASPGITDAEKAAALLAAVDASMGSPVTDDGVKQAEAYVVQLDALKGVEQEKIQAHSRLGGYFRAVDVDDKIFAHGNKVIELARALAPNDRTAMARNLAGAR
jgi:hypothetical protein